MGNCRLRLWEMVSPDGSSRAIPHGNELVQKVRIPVSAERPKCRHRESEHQPHNKMTNNETPEKHPDAGSGCPATSCSDSSALASSDSGRTTALFGVRLKWKGCRTTLGSLIEPWGRPLESERFETHELANAFGNRIVSQFPGTFTNYRVETLPNS
jgi:hypothetical protein